MDNLQSITQFKTGSTIANGSQLSDIAINKYKSSIDGLNLSQAQAALSATALNEAQKKQILTSAGLTKVTDSITASEIKQAVTENVLTAAKQQEILATLELYMEEGQLNLQKLEASVHGNSEAAAIANVIVAKKKENEQNLKNIASGKALNTVLKEQLLLLLKNPLTWAAIAAGAFVGLIAIIEKLNVTEEELNEQIKDLESNWSDLSSTIKNSAQTFQSLKKQADDLIPRYAELAQGVDKYGKNVSLTDEEFSEFISLNNQLGQMFPELVMGYDSNGDAILSLSGNVDTLTESLYACIEAQRIASAQTIADTMPDVMSNIDSTVKAYETQIQNVEDAQEDLKELYNTFKNEGFVEEWSSVGESMVSAVKILDKYGIGYNSEITGERNGTVGSTRYKITVDWDDFETSYNGAIAGLEKKTDDLISRIESKWKQLNPVVSAWLSTDFLYQDLDVSGKSLVTAMVGEIDFKSLGLKTEEEVQNYISNSIISPIYDMDSATQKAFFEVFDLHEALNNGELSIQEYQDKINSILENGNYSQEFITIFKLAFSEEDLQKQYDDAITRFAESETQTVEELKSKYQEAIDKRKELYTGENYIGNVDINNRPVVINDDGTYSTTSTSFQERQLDDGTYEIIHYTPILPDGTVLEGDALNTYIDKILSSSDVLFADNPANGGYGLVYKVDTEVNGRKITDGNLENAFGIADAWDVEMHDLQDKMYRDEAEFKMAIDESDYLEKFFTDNSINTAEEIDYWNKVTEGATSATEAVKMYNDAKQADGQSSAQWDVESFTNKIKSYEEGYSKLISAQEEWNEAKSISAETFAELQENGLLEYIEITSDGLVVNKEKLLENAQASKDKAVADLHAAMMSDLLKIALGNVDSVSEEAKTVIAELGDNTEEAGKQALNSVTNWGTLGATITATMAAARGEDRGFNGVSDEQRAQMDAVYNYYTDLADKIGAIDITTPTRTGKSGSKDAYVEAFEKELKSLQILRDSGEITEKEYLDRLKVLYEKYFKDRKKYLDEFKKYETEYLEGMESLYNSAISGIAKLYDKRIDGINKVKDALEEEKDARLEALETQIEAKQEVIDGIQDEIDKMQEANDERKRQIDLQKAQYELERLQNQKTQLIYKNGQMVYETDSSEIRNAREEVADAEFEIEVANKEKQISLIEKEIELLEKQKENVEDYYTKMIEQQEKLIESIEKQKSKWEELSEVREVAEAYSAIEQVFGDLGYSVEEVLNGSTGAFEDFKSKYLTILSEMDSNSSFGEGLTYAVDELDKSLSNIGNNTEGIDNLTSKMGEVADSVGNVTNAIGGVGGTTATAKNTSSGATATSTASASTGSLKSAMEDQTQTALDGIDKQVQAYAGDENSLKSAIEDVTESIGTVSKEGEEANPDTLIGATQIQNSVTNSIISYEITLFNKLKESIKGCVEQLREMSALMDKTGVSGSGNWKMMGTVPIYPNAKGTVGNAFAKGYNGLPHDEKNALRSEYGQPELTVYPDGTTELTTKPIMSDLPKDTVIFNEEQTRRIMNGKGTILGKAFANGTALNPVSTIQGIDIKSLQDKFLGKLDNIIVPVNSIDRNIESMVRVGNNIHTNNASQDINISIGDIQLQGVQDVNGLANAISTKLPNMLLQTITKR